MYASGYVCQRTQYANKNKKTHFTFCEHVGQFWYLVARWVKNQKLYTAATYGTRTFITLNICTVYILRGSLRCNCHLRKRACQYCRRYSRTRRTAGNTLQVGCIAKVTTEKGEKRNYMKRKWIRNKEEWRMKSGRMEEWNMKNSYEIIIGSLRLCSTICRYSVGLGEK